jgi:hypothetical protein
VAFLLFTQKMHLLNDKIMGSRYNRATEIKMNYQGKPIMPISFRFRILSILSIATLLIFLTIISLTPKITPATGAELPPNHPEIAGIAPIHGTAIVSTTLNDFFLPGTQAGTVDTIDPPFTCEGCHAGYAAIVDEVDMPEEHETWYSWQGSMMALSARDPLFWAALDIANNDANDAGEFCLRCHAPKAWYEGRSMPSDGSALDADAGDFDGVQCEICHRMVDPIYSEENPERDITVLAGITATVPFPASGMLIIDPEDERRGPYQLQDDWGFNPHSVQGVPFPLPSPYHQDSALCGACHDIINPLYSWDEVTQTYQPNALDTPGDPATAFPTERTYSEWLLSDYNSPEGVFAPEFGGNKAFVSSCQDCHMRDVTAAGAAFFGGTHIVREDLGLHDFMGSNTWVPQAILRQDEISGTHGFNETQVSAIEDGIVRAEYMLQNAATVAATLDGTALTVQVTNETGHKLPTGYPEGRRMWLQVEGYDTDGNLVYTSGMYDVTTAELTHDADLKIYHTEQGLTEDWAGQVGLPAGASFHFALNNTIVYDNRIPPRGYEFAAFDAVGAAPVTDGVADATMYADGQYWDVTMYEMPASVTHGTVRLLYQTASKEYIEFLRDNNPNGAGNRGEVLYDLWEQTGKSTPVVMAEVFFGYDLYLPTLKK